MRALIERQLYNPLVVLPMVALMELLVAVDFNLGQMGVVVATKGAQVALSRSREFMGAHQHETQESLH